MTQKIAIYARYSSDNQRDASIADQLRICQLFAKRQEWRVTNEYSDHALSGASLLRPGIQALIADALAGRFSIVLAEALDRLSRDQEDIAGLYKRMSFAGVKIVTISEGEISALHVGLKGTMNALFLKDLADKTRRGLRGRVEQGRSAGGNSYGYAVTGRGTDSARGERCINEKEAVIVRRIFEEYCSGKSPKKIAHDLNREGIPGPLGRHWGFSTINGSAKRGNGILNNELYIGRIVWNRQSFVKDPDTGRRQARLNPQSEWITHDVPGLRIVSDDLWHAAKRRQQRPEKQNAIEEPHFRDWRRPPLHSVGPYKMWMLWRRVFDDFVGDARMFHGAQQRNLRQQIEHTPRPTRKQGSQGHPIPAYEPLSFQRILRGVHTGDQ